MPVAVCSSCGFVADNPSQQCTLCGATPGFETISGSSPRLSLSHNGETRQNFRVKMTAAFSFAVIFLFLLGLGIGFGFSIQIERNLAGASEKARDDLLRDDLLIGAAEQLARYHAAEAAAAAARNDAVTKERKPASEVVPEHNASEIILSFIGDCVLGDNYYSSRFASYYDTYGPDYFFSGVKSVLSGDDLTIANCEGPFTSETKMIDKAGERNFWFKGKPEYAEIFQKGSVEIVNLANNHTFDYGQKGYLDTKTNLKRYGIAYFGNEEILIKEIKGKKIGFYGLYFGNITVSAIKNRIQRLQELGAEIIVGTFHSGNENQYTPTDFQKYTANQAVLLGTDIVIQHHPHVIQDVTWHSENKLIAYSLGNFCFGGNANPGDKRSIILQVKIDANMDMTYEKIPVLISGRSEVNDYRPVLRRINIE